MVTLENRHHYFMGIEHAGREPIVGIRSDSVEIPDTVGSPVGMHERAYGQAHQPQLPRPRPGPNRHMNQVPMFDNTNNRAAPASTPGDQPRKTTCVADSRIPFVPIESRPLLGVAEAAALYGLTVKAIRAAWRSAGLLRARLGDHAYPPMWSG